MSVVKFPHEHQHLRAAMARLEKRAAEYKRSPIQDDGEVFDLLDELVTFVSLQTVEHLDGGVPPLLGFVLGVAQDLGDYLPERLARAQALGRYFPDVAAALPRFPGWEGEE